MIETLKNNYKNNLELFRLYLPNIYNLLNKSSDINYSLEIENRDINLFKNGSLIYPKDTKKYFNELIKEYNIKGNGNLLRYNVTTPRIDDSKDIFGINFSHSKYIIKIIQNYKKIFNCFPFEKNEELTQDFIYTGIIYGIGLGYHIMPLINKYKFRHLVLVDIDVEMLRVSLYTINWFDIINYFVQDTTKSLSINIKENNNVDKLIINKLYEQYPLSYYNMGEFISYEAMDTIALKLKEYRSLFFPIRGFFDDEKWGLQHTIHNIKENIPILTNSNIKVDKNKFAFVIGNGPSLDSYIDIIKKYRDNIIMIASGSTITSLYKYDITPDIYVTIERTIDMYEMTRELPKKYLSKIIFIGANTTHPRVFSQFKKRFMFFKAQDAGANFINEQKYKILNHTNPSVTNGALSLTISLGFKNICLFGMDFGYKDNKNHHSKNSIHHNKNNLYYKEELKNQIELEGVDGDIIYSEKIYNDSRKHLEFLIETSPNDINIYNFSNGAKIAGTKRVINSKDIKLTKQKVDKKKIIKTIKKQFNIYEKNINIDYKYINKKINILEKEIKNYNHKNITVYEYLKFFDIFYKLFRKEFIAEYLYLKNLLNGTIITIMGNIYSYISTNKDTKNISLFIYSSLKILNNFLKESKKSISNIEKSIDIPFKWRQNG